MASGAEAGSNFVDSGGGGGSRGGGNASLGESTSSSADPSIAGPCVSNSHALSHSVPLALVPRLTALSARCSKSMVALAPLREEAVPNDAATTSDRARGCGDGGGD